MCIPSASLTKSKSGSRDWDRPDDGSVGQEETDGRLPDLRILHQIMDQRVKRALGRDEWMQLLSSFSSSISPLMPTSTARLNHSFGLFSRNEVLSLTQQSDAAGAARAYPRQLVSNVPLKMPPHPFPVRETLMHISTHTHTCWKLLAKGIFVF